MPIRILHLDPSQLIQNGLAAMLQPESDLILLQRTAVKGSLLQHWQIEQPNLLIIDPGEHYQQFYAELRSLLVSQPQAKVLVLGEPDNDAVVARCFQAGALGFLSKLSGQQTIIHAIRKVSCDKKFLSTAQTIKLPVDSCELTNREKEVLQFVSRGEPNKGIAISLCISEWTVKSHMKNILSKLKAMSRTEAVAIGVKRGLIGYF